MPSRADRPRRWYDFGPKPISIRGIEGKVNLVTKVNYVKFIALELKVIFIS
jgi:hypothetical protein